MAVKASATITISMQVDIAAYYRYYLLQSSTSTKPSKPTAYPLPEDTKWDDTEPTYTEGSTNTLYFVDLTVFSDDSFSYSEVSKSTSYEAAKEAYNKAENAQNTANSALSQVAEFIVGTQTAATGSWTGTSSNISALKDGLQINYWLPYGGSGNATLNLTLADGTTTGAKNCYLKGTTRLTTHFAAGSIIKLTYRIDATISGGSTKYTGWWADPGYDANTYDRTRYSSAVKTLEALSKSTYYIMVGTSAGYKKAASGVSFDVSYPVLAWNHSSAVSANKTTAYMYTSLPGVNIQHNKAEWTGTQYSMVYLVGTLSGTTFTINDTVFTSTVPTEVDGLHYIPIGVLYSTYQVYFRSDSTVYAYGSAGFAPISINAKQDADDAFDLGNTANNKADQLIEWKAGAQVDFDLIKGVLMMLAGDTSGDVTLFDQTANGWSFKFTDLNDSISNANSKIDVANADIDTLKEFMNENSEYIDFKTVTNENGDEEPCIELGVKNSPFKIQITNSRIIFVENDDIPTYIKDGTLNTEKVEVKQELSQSGFVWKVRANGNYGLSWKGV